MSEGDRLVTIGDKIVYTQESNKDLEKELRLLKRQQNLQGSELVRLENSETYPVKLKQLMEEVRFARERQMDQTEKLATEKVNIVRQNERIHNLEQQLQPFEDIDVTQELYDIEE